jgi:hypothetical protein
MHRGQISLEFVQVDAKRRGLEFPLGFADPIFRPRNGADRRHGEQGSKGGTGAEQATTIHGRRAILASDAAGFVTIFQFFNFRLP